MKVAPLCLVLSCLPVVSVFADGILPLPPPQPVTPMPLLKQTTINGIPLDLAHLPKGLKIFPELGLVGSDQMTGQVIHRSAIRILETRGLKTPSGDYLVMFPEGDHYANNKGTPKVNILQSYRSTDGGKTWAGPQEAFPGIAYSQHGFIPFVPKGSKRIYAFGTQPDPAQGYDWKDGKQENAPIGFRYSDDDGRTWSEPTIIRPKNDPDFMGMSVMRMTETDAGTWLLGSHTADWSVKPITTLQYLLRSEDKGKTWEVLPGKRPNGWTVEEFQRMDETRPLNLGGGKVMLMARTPAGSLFISRSDDDGKTWSAFEPTTLVHPGAPPMLFPIDGGKTLLAFHHNRLPLKSDPKKNDGLNDKAENMRVRSEIWFSLSTDQGRTWGPSQFLFANITEPNLKIAAWNFQNSYVDLFEDDGILHLIVPHRWQQVLHITLPSAALKSLPTKEELAAEVAKAK